MSIVVRIILAAIAATVWIMTFRIPYASISVIMAFVLARESPKVMLAGARAMLLGFGTGGICLLVGIYFFVDNQVTHFLFTIGSFFLVFFVIRTAASYGTAGTFATPTFIGITLWRLPHPAEANLEATLWMYLAFGVGIGIALVAGMTYEVLLPRSEELVDIQSRWSAVEDLLRVYAEAGTPGLAAQRTVARYSLVGTGRLLRTLSRNPGSTSAALQRNEQLTKLVVLIGKINDLVASLAALKLNVTHEDRVRLRRWVKLSANVRSSFMRGDIPQTFEVETQHVPSNGMPILPEIERTLSLIPLAFSPSEIPGYGPIPPFEEARPRYLVADAFTNPTHLQFALKGCLAASLCYIAFNAVAWPGISTSVTTCVLTAFSDIGASRQKQVLRICGAILGGLAAIASQVWILPLLDTIGGYCVLIGLVTAGAAWIYTSSPRLSYTGLQIAIAFYLVMFRDFTVVTDLSGARDRFVGVLLGLLMMWIVFDRLWAVPASTAMRRSFAKAIRQIGDLVLLPNNPNREQVLLQFRSLRESINASLHQTQTSADTVRYDFGAGRESGLRLRAAILQWQVTAEALFLSTLAMLQYRLQVPLSAFPESMREAHESFRKELQDLLSDLARMIEHGAAEQQIMRAGELLAHLEKEGQQQFLKTEGALTARAHGVASLDRQLVALTKSLVTDMKQAESLRPLNESAMRPVASQTRDAASGN
jgi:multidrug resistance protein MdtO